MFRVKLATLAVCPNKIVWNMRCSFFYISVLCWLPCEEATLILLCWLFVVASEPALGIVLSVCVNRSLKQIHYSNSNLYTHFFTRVKYHAIEETYKKYLRCRMRFAEFLYKVCLYLPGVSARLTGLSAGTSSTCAALRVQPYMAMTPVINTLK